MRLSRFDIKVFDEDKNKEPKILYPKNEKEIFKMIDVELLPV